MDLLWKEHAFTFTRRWFLMRNLPTFREFIFPQWAGKPLFYLELGVFEGMSLLWMLQRILTHPDSRAVGIDPWLITTKLDAEQMEEVRQRAFHNLSFYPQCQLIRGNSAEVLRRMVRRGGYAGVAHNTVDLCMIDGDHNALTVLDDARLCLKLVKSGGWLLFDDVENDREKQNHVKHGLQSFLNEHGGEVRFLWKHRYMEAYEKV